jgi:hypothetical protein
MAGGVRVTIKHEIYWCMVQDFRCCEKSLAFGNINIARSYRCVVAVLRTHAHVSTLSLLSVSVCICCTMIPRLTSDPANEFFG